jgi:osmotically-inducible protein OsmY
VPHPACATRPFAQLKTVLLCRFLPVKDRAVDPTSTSKLSDSDLEKAVRAKLENDAQLRVADLSVNADAERNEITLSGTVRTTAAREKAIELAKSAKPGVLVNDKIDIKPGA